MNGRKISPTYEDPIDDILLKGCDVVKPYLHKINNIHGIELPLQSW